MNAIHSALMGMTVGQLVGWGAGIIASLSIIIEFNKKIRFNPLTLALGWLGNKINAGMSAKFDKLEKQVEEISERQQKIEAISDERAAVIYRVRILRFADELRRNIKHSQESFKQVIRDIDNYEQYCDSHPDFKNNEAVGAKGRILASYDKCMQDNDFL